MPEVPAPTGPSAFAMTAVPDRRSSWSVGLLLGIIRIYQRVFSPLLPGFFGPACGCRFSPTCSHYAAGAVRTHGAFAGSWLALCRLARCTPLHRGGFDPVPPSPRLPPSLKLWRTSRRSSPPGPGSAGRSTQGARPVCTRVIV